MRTEFTTEDYQELIDLANAYIEERLDTQQRDRLEKILQTNPDARRIYVDYLHDHAVLHWQDVGDTITDLGDLQAENITSMPTQRFWLAMAATVAICAGILSLMWWNSHSNAPTSFATMEKTRSARWEGGTLPTAEGARLGAGNLRLANGLATLRFDSGAEVILEAPAEITLIDAMNCVLTRGTTVADIPDTALGFRIETPSANVVDYGTRFVVNVDSNTGATQTQVFEGLVEVEHPKSGELVKLKTGERNFAEGDKVGQATIGLDEGQWTQTPQPVRYGEDWTIFTSDRDTYVHAHEVTGHVSDVLLLLKNSNTPSGPSRISYLGFDLSSIKSAKVDEAKLFLHFNPTGWGLASNVPDAEFVVYGLIDSSLDDWNETDMTWQNAPANITEDGASLQSDKVVELGTFSIKQGIQHGRFGIRGDSLKNFLKNDEGFATLIVVRKTLETDGGGLVHAFASHRHPILPPPTLAIRLQE